MRHTEFLPGILSFPYNEKREKPLIQISTCKLTTDSYNDYEIYSLDSYTQIDIVQFMIDTRRQLCG